MSTSILELLENVEYNQTNVLKKPTLAQTLLPLAVNQLRTAIVLLEKGYPQDVDVSSLLEQYGNDVNAVPDYNQTSSDN